MLIALILLCVAVIVHGAGIGRPYGWIGGGLGILALLAGVTNLL
jgi:hypothetical protein